MDLNLKNREWKEFFISEIFDVSGTKTTHDSELKRGGVVPRITCKATNNGVEDTYNNVPTEKGGVITIDSATDGSINYQDVDFIATDHVEKISLKNNRPLNRYLGLFFVTTITHATFKKYRFGYKLSQKRILMQKIFLPITSEGDIDYTFMECYMQQKEYDKIKKYQLYIADNSEKVGWNNNVSS